MAIGLEIVALDNPVEGLQRYVFPVTGGTPMLFPEGFKVQVLVKFAPALAIGLAIFTVATTESELVQPLIVSVVVSV